MPHLAPMNWLICMLIFWSALAILMSVSWWTQTPSISPSYKPMSPQPQSWKWM